MVIILIFFQFFFVKKNELAHSACGRVLIIPSTAQQFQFPSLRSYETLIIKQ